MNARAVGAPADLSTPEIFTTTVTFRQFMMSAIPLLIISFLFIAFVAALVLSAVGVSGGFLVGMVVAVPLCALLVLGKKRQFDERWGKQTLTLSPTGAVMSDRDIRVELPWAHVRSIGEVEQMGVVRTRASSDLAKIASGTVTGVADATTGAPENGLVGAGILTVKPEATRVAKLQVKQFLEGGPPDPQIGQWVRGLPARPAGLMTGLFGSLDSQPKRRKASAVLLAVVMPALASCGGEEREADPPEAPTVSSPTKTTATNEDRSAKEGKPSNRPAPTPGVGDAISFRAPEDDGLVLDVRLTGVIDPLPPPPLTDPGPNSRYVGIEVEFVNQGTQPYDATNPSLGASLITSEGREPTGEVFFAGPCNVKKFGPIRPDFKRVGCIPFSAPEGAQLKTFRYDPFIIGVTSAEWDLQG